MKETDHDNQMHHDHGESPEARAAHGILSLLKPGEAQHIDDRVQRAMKAIELRMSQDAGRRRIMPSVAASIAGIAAMIALVFVVYPQTESRALAEMEISQTVEMMKAKKDRWYFIEVGRIEPGTGRGLSGDLYVTGDGPFLAFTYRRGHPLRPGPIIGDDGNGIWILPPDGQRVPPHAVPRMLAEFMPRIAEGSLDPASLIQLAQDDWTLTRNIIFVHGKKLVRIKAVSPPRYLPTRHPPGAHHDSMFIQEGSSPSLKEHVETILLDIDPETLEFVRLEISRTIDGRDFPAAFMLFTRDFGQHLPPGLSPSQHRLDPGAPPPHHGGRPMQESFSPPMHPPGRPVHDPLHGFPHLPF